MKRVSLHMSSENKATAANQDWLSINGLRKRFGRHEVLRDLSLAIAKGETVSILGPSGVGKSTLVKTLLGVVSADAGSIRLANRDISRMPIAQRNIGVVYQNYSLFEHMTARENVAFPLRARLARQPLRSLASFLGFRTEAGLLREVDNALASVRMSAHASKRPHQLSGGEQQRVALARALVLNPDLLCLDEPLAALDQDLRGTVLAEIRRLRDERYTSTLYVTHNVGESFSIGDRIGVMNAGRIEQFGPPRDVYYRPSNEFVGRATGELNVLVVESSARSGISSICVLRGGARVYLPSEVGIAGAKIGIRPERLRPEANLEQNRPGIEATLTRTTFLGALTRLELQITPGGQPVVALVGSDELGFDPTLARSLRLAYDPKDWIVFQ